MDKKKEKKAPVESVLLNTEWFVGKIRMDVKILSLVLFLIAVALYANTFRHHYVLDDGAVIFKNKFTTRGFAGMKDLLTTFYWQGYWNYNDGLYRPLSLILFAVEWQFFPNNPYAAHTINILLYAFTAVLLFTLLRRLLKNFPITVPFISTLIFIAHPVHTEVVANIKSGDEILCFLLFISTTIYFLNYIDTGKRLPLFLSLIFYFLCLFAKESGLTFLAVFPLLIYFFRGYGLKDSLKKSIGFLIPAIVFIALHEYVISHSGYPMIKYNYHDNSLILTPNIASRIATGIYIAGDYLKLLLLPLQLSCDYSFNQIKPVTFMNIQVIATIILVVLMGIYAIKKFKERNALSFVFLYYVITMALVSNIIMLIGATMAERFLYGPSLSFCVLLAIAGYKYLRRNHFLIVAIVLFALYSIRTIARNADWKNNLTLFEKDVKTSPRSANAHYNYGILYMDSVALKAQDPEMKKRLLATSLNELSEAVHIDSMAEDAYKDLGLCYFYLEDYSKSIENLNRSLQLNSKDNSIYADLGNAYFRNNKFHEAIEALNKAIGAGFISDNTYNYLGSAYFKTGDYHTAIEVFNKSLEQHPDDEEVLNNLGSAYATAHDYKQAINTFNKSLLVNPSNQRAYQFLGMIYQEMGDLQQAASCFEKARELNEGQQ